MDELQRIGVKFYARDPESIDLSSFIPVFHEWIQQHKVEGTLIDVADYTHVPHGPGVILIGVEADYYLDTTEGPAGLLYIRKSHWGGTLAGRIRKAFAAALGSAALLEAETSVKFHGEKVRVILNDRLAAPNDDETFVALQPHLKDVLGSLYPEGDISVSRDSSDSRRRLAVDIQAAEPVSVGTLLQRVASAQSAI